MQRQHPRRPQDPQALLRLLQAAAFVAKELVVLAQRLGGGEIAQTRRQRGVLLNVEGEVEEELFAARHGFAAQAFCFVGEGSFEYIVDPCS